MRTRSIGPAMIFERLWKETQQIEGVDRLQLHHLYRAMAWLGESLPEDGQDGKRFLLRSGAQGTCGRVFAATGVALPPTVQQIEAS